MRIKHTHTQIPISHTFTQRQQKQIYLAYNFVSISSSVRPRDIVDEIRLPTMAIRPWTDPETMELMVLQQ